MGNCMETCALKQEKGEETEGEGGGKREGGLKVRMLLTRGELEWLMAQLKEKGEKKLEDVLAEIGRERERGEGDQRVQVWKPSLESIMEIPEAQSFDDVDQ